MKKALIVILVLAIAAFIVGITITKKKSMNGTPSPVATSDSIEGCYVATLAKDVYTLTIASQQGSTFNGTLSFKNFEKDSSSGTYAGTYENGILLGDYSFASEGMNSVMQVIFKKTASGFIRGYGDVDETGTRFTDLNTITYDTTAEFVKTSENCAV